MPENEMEILATKLPRAQADAYRKLAKETGKPVSRLLSDHIRKDLGESNSNIDFKTDAQHCLLTTKNVNRLFREAAHYSKGLNPDQIVNKILILRHTTILCRLLVQITHNSLRRWLCKNLCSIASCNHFCIRPTPKHISRPQSMIIM